MTDLRFDNKVYARRALTPKGAVDDPLFSYEKLEYLGDSMLDAVVSCRLFAALPHEGEGQLSEIRTGLVRNEELWKVGLRLGLGELMVDRQLHAVYETATRSKALADMFEALIGAFVSEQRQYAYLWLS